MKEYKHISLLEAFDQDFDDMEENERAMARDIIDDDYDDAVINDVLDELDFDDDNLDDEYWEFPDVYTVADNYADNDWDVNPYGGDTYDFDNEEEANAKFDELKAKYGPEDNTHTLCLFYKDQLLRKYNPQYGIKDEYKDPTITECAKASSIDEAVAIMNEGDDDVECCRCHEMFDKCDCRKCDEGYVCNECGGKEMNEGCCDPDPESSVKASKDVPVKDCPINDVITHCKEENPDCEMKKKPLDKPLTEDADRRAMKADLKNSEDFKTHWVSEVEMRNGTIADGDKVRILSKLNGEWSCYTDSPWGNSEEEEWTADTDEDAFDEMLDWCDDDFIREMHGKYCSGNGIKESVDGEEAKDKTYECEYDGHFLGYVHAANEDEAFAKMMDKWPEYNFSLYDGIADVYEVETDDESDNIFMDGAMAGDLFGDLFFEDVQENVNEDGGMDEWIKNEHSRGLDYEFVHSFDFGEDEVYCSIWFDKRENKFAATVETYHISEDDDAEDPEGHTDCDDYIYNTMGEFMNSDDIPDEFREYVEDEYAEYVEELRLEREAETDDEDIDESIDIEGDDGSVTIISDDVLNQMDVRDEEADGWIKANNKKLDESSAEDYISRIKQGMSSLEI